MIYLKEGNIPLNFAYDDEIVQEANSTYQLKFKFPVNNALWESLTEETLLLADDLHGEQEFIIFEVERHHSYISVYANQVATLLNNYSISELNVSQANGNRVMRSLVSSIIRSHNFTFYSDIATRHDLNLKNVTVATALFKDKHSILGQWGGDLVRDKYDIKLLYNGGINNEALFMYKKNLKSYQQKKTIKDLRTRIHFTKTITENDTDKVISVTVDSPLINKYKNIYEGNLEVNDQDVVDLETLTKYGENYFKTSLCDVIEDTIEIDVVGSDIPIRMFDTVNIFHEKFGLDVKKKISKYTFSPMARKLKSVGFGKFQQGFGSVLSSMIEETVTETVESKVDGFKIQENLKNLIKLDRASLDEKMKTLEEQAKGAVEVKRALFDADGTIPEVVRTKVLDAVEADIGRLKTIITEAELIKAIQAHLDYADIKNAIIDKAFIKEIISDETFRQEFEDGEVTTQNIFTKLKDSIQSNIRKDFITKDETKRLVNDLTINADGIRQITQEESEKIFKSKKNELKGDPGRDGAPGKNGVDGKPGRDGNSFARNYLAGTAEPYTSTLVNDKFAVDVTVYNFVDKKSLRELGFKAGDKITFVCDYEVIDNKKISSLRYEYYKDTGYKYETHVETKTKGIFIDTKVVNDALLDSNKIALRADNVNAKIITSNARLIKSDKAEPWTIAQEDLRGQDGRDGKDVGINLVPDSGVPESKESSTWSGDWSIRRHPFYYNSGRNIMVLANSTNKENYIISPRFKLERNTDYVLSFKGFASGNTQNMDVFILGRRTGEQASYTIIPNNAPLVKNKILSNSKLETVKNIAFNSGEMDEAFLRFDNNGSKNAKESILFIAEVKLEKGTVSTDWTPAIEDLQGHSLTANLRFEGTYINNITNNVKVFVDVFYDGQRLANGFDLKWKFNGSNRTTWSKFGGVTPVNNDGYIPAINWGNKEQNGTPLEVIVSVSYKGLNALASGRMENIPDVVEIKETVKKYKTFDSTLEQFNSTIGEIREQTLANEENRNLILGSRLFSESDYKVFGTVWDGTSRVGIYTKIRQDINNAVTELYGGSPYLFVISENNTKNVWQGVGFNISKKKIFKGETYTIKLPIYIMDKYRNDGGIYLEIKNHKTNIVLYKVKLDSYDAYTYIWDIRTFKFTADRDFELEDYSFWVYAVKNGGFCISTPYMCLGDKPNTKYSPAPEDIYLQNSRIESSIKQNKEEIGLSVKKGEIISSINVSTEGIKIKNGLIADRLEGKTIAVGDKGYFTPWNNGIRVVIPGDSPGKGVGIQMNGVAHSNLEKGLNVFNLDSISTPDSPALRYNEYVATFHGRIKSGFRFYNSKKKKSENHMGEVIVTNVDRNDPLRPVGFTSDGNVHGPCYSKITVINWLWGVQEGSRIMFGFPEENNVNYFAVKIAESYSDERLKKEVKPSKTNALELIDKLKFKQFKWNNKSKLTAGRAPVDVGLIAQDVEKLNKNLVSKSPDYLELETFKLLMYGLKAIQELSSENKELKSRLELLEERVSKLEK